MNYMFLEKFNLDQGISLRIRKMFSTILRHKIWITSAFMGLPFTIMAGGFQVNLMGIKQIGLGHVGTALKLDASAVYFNPGMMPFLENKFNFAGGVSGIASTVAYRTSDGGYAATTDNSLSTPFNIYASMKINKTFSAGLAVYTPFGSSATWDPSWKGRYLVQNISLRAIFVQPTVSVRLTDKLGIGVGIIYTSGNVDINRAVPAGSNSTVNLNGSTSSFGFQAGVYFEPTDKLSLGVTYRSQINMEITNGTANFQVPASLAANFPSGNTFSAKLPLPGSINVGIGYKVTDKLLIGLDASYIFWNTYDSLVFDFSKNTSSLQDSHNPRLYNNAFIIRLGGQYKISDMLTIRAGAYFDQSPSNNNYYTPETPDADRIGLSCGVSVVPVKNFSIDASFLYIHGLERTANYAPGNFGGTYKVNALVPAIGVSYSF